MVSTRTLIAFDSKEFSRGVIRPFYTPVGAGVVIDDERRNLFEEAISRTKINVGIQRETKCLTYRDFAVHLGKSKCVQPIRGLIESLDGVISEIHYYFLLTRLSDIKIYGRDMPEEISRESFLKKLGPSFVLSAAWKYFSERPDEESSLIMDHFSSEITGGAEDILSREPDIHIRGDECHYAVNLADLAAGYFDLEFDARNWRINETDPRELFPGASFKVTFNRITTQDFHAITPLERRRLRITEYVKHPVIFLINEKRPPELEDIPTSEIFDKLIYRNRVWHRTLNLAYDLGGSTKLLEPREDLELVQDGDILIYTGSKGRDVAKYFHGHCPDAIMMKARELFDEGRMSEIREDNRRTKL